MNQTEEFAEIIESSLYNFTAQTWKWDDFPQFGSLVTIKTTNYNLFGLVYYIKTGSFDNNRTPFAYKKTEEELHRELPHIFELLQTTFTCINLGYQENNKILHQLAPTPPKIHAFVYPASQHELLEFFKHDHFLQILFKYSQTPICREELLLALLSYLDKNNILTQDKLAQFIKTLALLTGNDYRYLKLFLQRVQHSINL